MKKIGIDFQGWFVHAMNLREILNSLGFKEEDGKIFIENTNPLLEAYPIVLQDDGMGYGVNQEYVIDADKEIYVEKLKTVHIKPNPSVDEETITVFNLFRSAPENNVDEED